MSIRQIVECDGCNAPKTTTNGWFALVKTATGFYLARMHDLEGKKTRVAAHLCSQKCATQAFQQWMDAK